LNAKLGVGCSFLFFEKFSGEDESVVPFELDVGVGGAVFGPVGAGALAAEGALGNERDWETWLFPEGNVVGEL